MKGVFKVTSRELLEAFISRALTPNEFAQLVEAERDNGDWEAGHMVLDNVLLVSRS